MALLEHRNSPKSNSTAVLFRGIRILAWARAIRWAGWGFGEALIPIFIASFSGTFVQMGMLTSTFEVAALVSLPLIGVCADRMSAKKLVLLALLLYPLVGINYFIAGTFSASIFIIFAKAINGFTSELETVGIETYYRRTSHRARIAASFGYLDTLANAAWICAALIGVALVSYVPIHNLLLGISPFALIAYLVALRAPKDFFHNLRNQNKTGWRHAFRQSLNQMRGWHPDLRLLSALIVFLSVINALTDFFIPVEVYRSGSNLSMVVLLTVFGAVPSLFGYQLGRLADMKSKSGLIAVGLLIVACIVAATAVISGYWFKLIVVFVIGLMVEMFGVIKRSLITTLGPAHSYGIRGSTFEGIGTIGDLIAPVTIGVILDTLGFRGLLLLIGGMATLLSITYSVRRAYAK